MIKVKKTSYPPVNMGLSLMLVVFIILCMVVLSVLSLSTALKDYDYSAQNAKNTIEYYEACNKAELELQKLNETLSSYEDYDTLEYTTKVNDEKALYVEVELLPSENTYSIKTWKLISTTIWEGDDSISVLGSH